MGGKGVVQDLQRILEDVMSIIQRIPLLQQKGKVPRILRMSERQETSPGAGSAGEEQVTNVHIS